MKKHLLVLSVVSVIAMLTPFQAGAADYNKPENQQVALENAVPYAAGLITNYSLGCSKADKAVEIIGKTSASSSMSKIGFKDIIVERSSDNINWEDEVDVGDKLTTSASTYSLANYSVSVEGGYYYRVKCKHYAKEKGLFGRSQSVENHSNSVWID